eukprot:XP_014630589.1 callose synthase 3-like [Glycine max]
MAFELYGMLVGNVSPLTGELVKPAYGGDNEAFLMKVVKPIYDVIAKEAERSNMGKAKHSHWRNYDDLNEYFWSVDCFRLGWPMRVDSDFFSVPFPQQQHQVNKHEENRGPASDRWSGKTNFVEIRTFWHIFRSFDRMWSFYILCLQNVKAVFDTAIKVILEPPRRKEMARKKRHRRSGCSFVYAYAVASALHGAKHNLRKHFMVQV